MTNKTEENRIRNSSKAYIHAIQNVTEYMKNHFPDTEWEIVRMESQEDGFITVKIDTNSRYAVFRNLDFKYNAERDQFRTPESDILCGIHGGLLRGYMDRKNPNPVEGNDKYRNCYVQIHFMDEEKARVDLGLDPTHLVNEFIRSSRPNPEERENALDHMMEQFFLMFGNDDIQEKEFCVEACDGSRIIVIQSCDGRYHFLTE